MNIEQTKKASEIIIKAGLVPMWWGPPGIGKTTAARQISEIHKVDFRTLTTNYLMLEHLTGIPYNDGAKMIFSRPENIPGDGKGILLLDEITDGMQSIQKMLYSLVLEGVCNGHQLGDGWKLIAAGNRPSDGSGSSMLPSALITRMIHLGVCCEVPDFKRVLPETADMDASAWVSWALDNDLNPLVIAFIKSFPDKLYSYQAIPRTFEMLSKILKVYNQADPVLHAIICGCIGPEVGNDFYNFLRLAVDLPDIDSIIKDPLGSDIPEKTGIVYALSAALVYKADRANFDNILKYVARFSEKELEIFCVESIRLKNNDLASLPGYIAWHNANQKYLN